MKINLPNSVKLIINTLITHGYEAYAVGGCVRDSLLGRIPKDWDITTNALPDSITDIFKDYKVIPTGIQHGTVTVVIEGINYEVTTYRIDGKYSDNRRPDSVEFTSCLREDLSRRDFTINAMAYNDKDGLIDYFNGREHVKYGFIKCVGNARDRFKEDALRIIRAIRFAVQLGFQISMDIDVTIFTSRELLKNISKERIRDEFNKILMSDNIQNLSWLSFENIIPYICPEIESTIGFSQKNPYHTDCVWKHTLKATHIVEENLILKLVMFFHDAGKPECFTEDDDSIGHFYGHAALSEKIAFKAMTDLRYDNKTIERVCKLVKYHDYDLLPKKTAIKRLINKIGEENIELWVKVKIADILAQNPKYAEGRLRILFEIENLVNTIKLNNECFSRKNLNISGNDIMKTFNLSSGKSIGCLLEKLVEVVILDPSINDKDTLLKIVQDIIEERQ